jgi:hypothetical protein
VGTPTARVERAASKAPARCTRRKILPHVEIRVPCESCSGTGTRDHAAIETTTFERERPQSPQRQFPFSIDPRQVARVGVPMGFNEIVEPALAQQVIQSSIESLKGVAALAGSQAARTFRPDVVDLRHGR